MNPEDDFEHLTLADGSKVHLQGYVQFVLHCGNYKTKALARVFPNLHEELTLGIHGSWKRIPQLIGQLGE